MGNRNTKSHSRVCIILVNSHYVSSIDKYGMIRWWCRRNGLENNKRTKKKKKGCAILNEKQVREILMGFDAEDYQRFNTQYGDFEEFTVELLSKGVWRFKNEHTNGWITTNATELAKELCESVGKMELKYSLETVTSQKKKGAKMSQKQWRERFDDIMNYYGESMIGKVSTKRIKEVMEQQGFWSGVSYRIYEKDGVFHANSRTFGGK